MKVFIILFFLGASLLANPPFKKIPVKGILIEGGKVGISANLLGAEFSASEKKEVLDEYLNKNCIKVGGSFFGSLAIIIYSDGTIDMPTLTCKGERLVEEILK